MANEIELIGMDDLLNKLEQMGKQGKKIEKQALKKAGEVMSAAAKSEAPVYDGKPVKNVIAGKLKNSIKVSPIKKKGNTHYVWVGDVDREAEYGWYHEFGTSKLPANPWLTRAYDKAKDEIREVIASEIKGGLGL